ncbi:hypothetical protein [Kitasatospora camelliae]|uniref:Antitoxin protein of toxin-antitoxin system n=1 Tax=Kitasatospora camelliae TaxID=3156397 RepID=A0AAU8K882_9ACTN
MITLKAGARAVMASAKRLGVGDVDEAAQGQADLGDGAVGQAAVREQGREDVGDGGGGGGAFAGPGGG